MAQSVEHAPGVNHLSGNWLDQSTIYIMQNFLCLFSYLLVIEYQRIPLVLPPQVTALWQWHNYQRHL